MTEHVGSLIAEGKEWLAAQVNAAVQTERWYALGNFEAFIDRLDADPSPDEIFRAVHALRRFISDQYEWSEEYCKVISDFCRRADQVRRALGQAE